jgi:hypothetical protein
MSYKIMSIISAACDFTTKSGGIWKIFGKEENDEITVGRQAQSHPIKQEVVLYVTLHAERDVIVLDSKTGSVTPV